MALQSDALQWITVDDFRPGIQHRPYFTGATNLLDRRLGVARESGTHRCRALENGALGPAPRRTDTYTPTYPVDPTTTASGRLAVSGTHLAQPIEGPSGSTPDLNAELHVAYEWVDAVSGDIEWRWQRHKHWDTPIAVSTVKSITVAAATHTHDGTQCRPTMLHSHRAHPSDNTQPGQPVVVAGWFPGAGFVSGSSNANRAWHAFPDPSNPTTTTPAAISTNFDAEILLSHQGRALLLDREGFDLPDSAVWTHNEELYFTDDNSLSLASSTGTTFGGGNATGYTAAVSTSASELLLIKTNGGGYLVRGDVSDPTVTRLAGIPGGNLSNIHQPATAPIGVVFYIPDSGVWLWSGGEFAEHLSPDLDNEAFDLASDFIDYRGRLWAMRDYVFCQNNWLYDWRHESWWRIEDPADIQIFAWGPELRSNIFGFPSRLSSTSDPLMFRYGLDSAARSYNWRSQPFPVGVERDAKIRKVRLVASGSGTVRLRVRSLDGTRSDDTFTVASTTHPTYFTQDLAIDTRDIEFELTVDGGANPAPVVHEVAFGVDSERTLAPKNTG